MGGIGLGLGEADRDPPQVRALRTGDARREPGEVIGATRGQVGQFLCDLLGLGPIGGEIHIGDPVEPDPEVAQLHRAEAGESNVLVPVRGDRVQEGASGDELPQLLLLLDEVAVDRLQPGLVVGFVLELRRLFLLAFEMEEDRVRPFGVGVDVPHEIGSLGRFLVDGLLFRAESLDVGLELEVLRFGEDLHQIELGQ